MERGEKLMELPRFVMFKSPVDNDNKYLCDRIIKSKCDGKLCTLISFAKLEGLGTDAVHQVVMAKCEGGLIHIRSIGNGKYWSARKSESYYNVSAVVDEPKEDKSSKDCTLFKPSFCTKEGVNTIRLQHWRDGKFSFVCLDKDGNCSAGHSNKLREPISLIADSWEPLLIKYFKDADLEVTVSDRRNRLPKFVVFKSAHNDKYLCCDEDKPNLLKFKGKDAQSQYSKHEVVRAKCGYGLVHIKCCHTRKYWRKLSETENWIVAQADEIEEDLSKWSCTLFYPYYPKEADYVVQLQFSQLGEYPIIYQDCLSLPTGKSAQTTPVGLIWEQFNNPPEGKPSKPPGLQPLGPQASRPPSLPAPSTPSLQPPSLRGPRPQASSPQAFGAPGPKPPAPPGPKPPCLGGKPPG